jgi:hypothetical protein
MLVPLDKFDKEELVFINILDYVNHYGLQAKIETLEQLLDNEKYLKTQMIDRIINTNSQIKYLLEINKEYVKTIMKQDNDIEEQLNNDISINQLKKQLLNIKL